MAGSLIDDKFFPGVRLWQVNSDDIASASNAISSGFADGLLLNESCGFKEKTLDFLKEMPLFTALAITYCKTPLDASYLSALTHLKHLAVATDLSKNLNIEELNNLVTLKVDLSSKFKFPNSIFENLKTLLIRNLRLENLEFLSHLPNLEKLYLWEARNLISLHGLKFCRLLQQLDIAYCPKLADVSELINLNQLRNLELASLKRLADISPIYEINDLLFLKVNKVSPVSSIYQIKKLKSLQHLAWIETEIEDGDLSPLLEMPNLTHCHVRPNKKHYQPTATYLYDTIKARSLLKD